MSAGSNASSITKLVARWVLALFLLSAGIGHFVSANAFMAQVPEWMPMPGLVVTVSGVIELVLAIALMAGRRVEAVGWVVAIFFIIVFPGNISQYVTQTDAFGLDTDGARFIRLLFQPVLVVWALWSTGAWAQRPSFRSFAGRNPTK